MTSTNQPPFMFDTVAMPPADALTQAMARDFTPSGSVDDWGDFVDPDYECDIEGVAEDPNLYPRGLLYPICIGEVVADRYRINHKLGHGGYSTVWMAFDMAAKTDVALKILMPGESAERECRMQDEISRAVSDTTHLLLCQGSFSLPCPLTPYSPHAYHRVLVFPLQGPNLRDYPRKKPVATRISFAVQLLQALNSLHGGGFVHGDLNSANVMYSLRPLDDCSTTTAKYKYLGRPQKMRLFTEQWKQGELVMPMEPHESLVGDTILLGDFGLAHKAGTSTAQKLQAPARYCAPERLHKADPSFASDMWSYTCLFFELYTTVGLNPGWNHASVLSRMVDMIGPLPASWKGSYYAGDSCDDVWYDQDQRPKPSMAIEAKIVRFRPDIDPTELKLVMSVLSWGLCYLPEHRPTAAQLLDDSSFKALVAIYGL